MKNPSPEGVAQRRGTGNQCCEQKGIQKEDMLLLRGTIVNRTKYC